MTLQEAFGLILVSAGLLGSATEQHAQFWPQAPSVVVISCNIAIQAQVGAVAEVLQRAFKCV